MSIPNPKSLFLVLPFLLFTVFIAQGQDLIVSIENDSINCKITMVDENSVHYKFQYDKKFIPSILLRENISTYKYGYYDYMFPYSNNRWAFDFGGSFRVAKLHDDIPPNLKEFTRQLKSGVNYGVSYTHFYNRTNGLGFKYSLHNSKNEKIGIVVPGFFGSSSFSTIKERINITYIAPFYSCRVQNLTGGNVWLFNFGMGYLRYNDKVSFTSTTTYTGNTLGFNLDIGHDFILSESFALGFQFSYVAGTLTRINDGRSTTDLDKKDYESLNRLDITFGIRFY